MKEHIEKLEQKQAEITSKLKTMELPMQTQDCSTEIISQRENLQMKLNKMTQNAKQEIDAMVSLTELKIAYLRQPKKLTDQMVKKVKFRIITEKTELDAFTQGILKLSETNGNPIELRQIEKIPFNLTIADDKEAAWGDPLPENEASLPLWTNNPTQITILKTAFESLWQKASQPQSLKPYATASKHHTKQHEKPLQQHRKCAEPASNRTQNTHQNKNKSQNTNNTQPHSHKNFFHQLMLYPSLKKNTKSIYVTILHFVCTLWRM
jgi:hypothetical protein